MLQPDLGTSIIIAGVAVLPALMTDVSNHALAIWGVVFAGLYGLTYLDASILRSWIKGVPGKPFLQLVHNPWSDQRNAGYQSIQAIARLSRGS